MKIKTTMTAVALVLGVLANATHLKADVPSSMPSMNDKKVSDLQGSVQDAMNQNPEISLQKSDKEATAHKVTQSIGAYLPSIDLRAGAGKEYEKEAYKKNALASVATRGSENKTRYDPSITLNQKIFDGMLTPYDIEKSKRELIQSEKNVEEAQILVAFDVADRYISVRRFERLVKLAENNVRTHQSILSKIRKLVQGGKATTADEKNVLSRLYDAKAAVSDIQGDLDTAYANFKEVVGSEANSLKRAEINNDLVPASVQEAIEMAIKNNRSVIVAKATEDVARSDFDKTISPFMPALDLQLQAKRNYDVGGKTGVETNAVAQVIGTFNVFNGMQDIGKRRELRAKMSSAKYSKHKEMLRAEKEIRVSYAELISARAQSKALRGAVGSKKDVRIIYMKQFEAGTRNFLDILDASHEYFLAKGSLITSDATQDLAVARLLASMGTLFDMFQDVNLSVPVDMSNEENKLEIVSNSDENDDDAVVAEAADTTTPTQGAADYAEATTGEAEVVAEASQGAMEMPAAGTSDMAALPTETMESRTSAYTGQTTASLSPKMAQVTPNTSEVY